MPTVSTMRHCRGRDVRKLQETLLGQSLLHGLKLYFSSNPHPWSLCQSCIEALSPPAQVFCQSLTHSSELPQYNSPAWQSQGWVWSWSPSSSHLHELWDVTHRVQFMPWPIPLPPLAAQPFQSSLLLLPHCIFSHCFMQSSQETKKKSIHTFILQAIHCITAKHNLLIIFSDCRQDIYRSRGTNLPFHPFYVTMKQFFHSFFYFV